MRLDTKQLRYLTPEDWRTLTAVETGSKNHEVVPTQLIGQISGLRSGVHRSISSLAKVGLIARMKNAKYDGYRLTYGGLDYLALNTYRKRKDLYSVGNQIGVGKESDIFVVANEEGAQMVLKIHRLGRISFRTVKTNRDYLKNQTSGSWMYLSRLAALKEYTFMKALRENGFPVPEPLAQSRHTIVMSLIDAFPMRQISSVPNPAHLYAELISMIMRLAQYGLIHGDFNEFNILIKEETIKVTENGVTNASILLTPILIDFPQMVSVDHTNAEYYFDRDVNCIKRFFERRYHFTSDEKGPSFAEARKLIGKDGAIRLDVSVAASGFSKKMAKELENYMSVVGQDGQNGENSEPEYSNEDEDSEESGVDDTENVDSMIECEGTL
ncbi:BgTH12-03236 [Blumeria graminis f. sp. triticale]|uniref:Serine/threonine-protein kinase RIO2 n=3 Tax=Blumeria graminis TaxID=34373 RepID=A0A061HFX1_BLUGR|nr:serine kinase [Blumeria graminis f. sp. tritici 96224]CAD6503576.1 BgTH12-03236 [Blumeria graminis f. sp. triticale]VDB89718.1 Bgt-4157 [Blumeria graminis f. sp. tritici]